MNQSLVDGMVLLGAMSRARPVASDWMRAVVLEDEWQWGLKEKFDGTLIDVWYTVGGQHESTTATEEVGAQLGGERGKSLQESHDGSHIEDAVGTGSWPASDNIFKYLVEDHEMHVATDFEKTVPKSVMAVGGTVHGRNMC